MKELSLSIKLEAPSGNHYVKHTRSGRHYKTAEALAWIDAVAIVARGQQVNGKAHEVTYVVYQGFNSKGDVDNYCEMHS